MNPKEFPERKKVMVTLKAVILEQNAPVTDSIYLQVIGAKGFGSHAMRVPLSALSPCEDQEEEVEFCHQCDRQTHPVGLHLPHCPECGHWYTSNPCGKMTDYGPCNSDYRYCKCKNAFHKH